MKRYIAHRFDAMSAWIAYHLGTPNAFMLACFLVFTWVVTGPYFEYSDTWQLVINTGTTIATFLMVFVLQNTGNRTIDEMHERLKRLETQNQRLIEVLEKIGRKP